MQKKSVCSSKQIYFQEITFLSFNLSKAKDKSIIIRSNQRGTWYFKVWCLVKGNESHSTVNPIKDKTTQNISLRLIDILFVLFIEFSSLYFNGHFSTHAISDSHPHSASYSLNPFPSLFLLFSCLLPTPFIPFSISYKKKMIWTIGIIE